MNDSFETDIFYVKSLTTKNADGYFVSLFRSRSN